MMYEVKKNVEISKQLRQNNSRAEFLRSLEIGDMFEDTECTNKKNQWHGHAQKAGITVKTRKLKNGNMGVWRTS